MEIGRTQEIFDLVLSTTVKGMVKAAELRSERERELKELDRSLYENMATEKFVKESQKVIDSKMEESFQALANGIMKINEEFANYVNEWGRMDGNKLTRDIEILDRFGDLTKEELVEMRSHYNDNYPMQKAILGAMDKLLSGGEDVFSAAQSRAEVRVQTPKLKKDLFTKYCKTMVNLLGAPARSAGLPDQYQNNGEGWAMSLTKAYLNDIYTMDEEYDFSKYEVEPKIPAASNNNDESAVFKFNFTPIR